MATEVGKPGTNWKQVGPREKKKLSGLVRYYMKKAHPFTACVRDNTKRFGPDRAKRVCAVVKDIGRRTTKWRKGGRSEDAIVALVVGELVEELDDALARLRGAEATGDLTKLFEEAEEPDAPPLVVALAEVVDRDLDLVETWLEERPTARRGRCPSCGKMTVAGTNCEHCGASLEGKAERENEAVLGEAVDAPFLGPLT